MVDDFRNTPIVLPFLKHTGEVDGNDKGYRKVRVSPLDKPGTSDPLVVCNSRIRCMPIYSVGSVPGLCPYYGSGIGAPQQVFLRAPALNALIAGNDLLKKYNREFVILDGWRSAETQSLLWKDVFNRICSERSLIESELTLTQFLQCAMDADDIGSFADVIRNEEYDGAFAAANSSLDFNTASNDLQKPTSELVELYVIFQANLGRNACILDESGNTAHGGGGASDVFLWNTETNQYTCLGVPFDFVGAPKRDGLVRERGEPCVVQ